MFFFFLYYHFFVWFSYWGNAAIIGWIRMYFFCFYSSKEIIENWYNSFLKCLVEFTSDTLWAWCSLFWKVIVCWFNFLIDIDLFRLFITSFMSFGECFFQGIDPFHVGCQICGHRFVHNVPLLFCFNVPGIWGNIYSFIPDNSLYCFSLLN